MSGSTTTFLTLAVVVAVFVWDRLPVGIVALGTALSLWARGVLDYEQIFVRFGAPSLDRQRVRMVYGSLSESRTPYALAVPRLTVTAVM